jgi:SulP family sulfate permease
MSALHEVRSGARVVVLDLSAVPVIDATGLVNLRSALSRLHKDA